MPTQDGSDSKQDGAPVTADEAAADTARDVASSAGVDGVGAAPDRDGSTATVAFGSWPSALSPTTAAGGSVRVSSVGLAPDGAGGTIIRWSEQRPDLGGFPLILKPDSAQRGFAVRLIHGYDDALAYFHEMTRAAVAQRYHPGPSRSSTSFVSEPLLLSF